MSLPSVNVKDSNKTQVASDSESKIANGHQIIDSHNKVSTLDQRQKISKKSHTKLKKKLVSTKKVSEVYEPPPLSPYLLLIISLLYMVAADGLIREDEISLLQSVTGADKSIINKALKYTQKIKLSDFLIIAPPLLNAKDRICILLNILDLMLIDGNTAEAELDYFFHLQEVFGFTDVQMKPYLSILKIKTNKKILGDFNPKYLNTNEFTPHLIFGAALIYMLSVDGIVNDNEVEQLQSNIANFTGLFEAASSYSKANSVEQFLWDIRSKLNQQQSLFILINTYDLLLSDGHVQDEEGVLFDRFLAALGFDQRKFKPYASLIELKNKKPSQETSQSEQIPLSVKVVDPEIEVKKKTPNDDHHLREINSNDSLVSASSHNKHNISNQFIDTQVKPKDINQFSISNEQKGTMSTTPSVAKLSNIQNASSGSESKNIQALEVTNLPQSAESQVANPVDHIKEGLLSESNKSLNESNVVTEKSAVRREIDQFTYSEASIKNTQTIQTDQGNVNIQSLTEQNPFAKTSNKDFKNKDTDSINLQTLDETNNSNNLQTLQNPSGAINEQLLDQLASNTNIQPINNNNSLDSNIALISSSHQFKNTDTLENKEVPLKSNQNALASSANKTNRQNLNADSIESSQIPVKQELMVTNSTYLLDNPPLSKGILNIEINSTLKDSFYKENETLPLQKRFAAIYTEIDDVHEKLDLLESSASDPDLEIPDHKLTNSNHTLADIDHSSQGQTNPIESVSPYATAPQFNPDLAYDSVELNHEPIPNSDDDLPNDAPLESNLSVQAFTLNENNEEAGKDIQLPSNRGIDVNPKKNKALQSSKKQIISDSNTTFEPSLSSDYPQSLNPLVNSNKQSISQAPEHNNPTPLDAEVINQADASIDSNIALISKPKVIDTNSAQKINLITGDEKKQNLAVFALPKQIFINNSTQHSEGFSGLDQVQLFETNTTDGFTVADVFIQQTSGLNFSDHYNRSTYSSKILEPKKISPFTRKLRPEVSLTFIKFSVVVGIAAFIGLYSFDTNVDIYAPCPGQTCEGRQTGAPLMIKPIPPSDLQNAFSILYTQLNHEV